VIKVRLAIRDVAMGAEGSLERQLEAAGIPPAAFLKGRVKQWSDADYFYYQYSPREESEITTPDAPVEHAEDCNVRSNSRTGSLQCDCGFVPDAEVRS
jgi:hypothetical protein